MAHDDRDRTLEKALARQLRSSAYSGMNAKEFDAAPAVPSPIPRGWPHDGSLIRGTDLEATCREL
jgi:hypothetical protein